MLVALVLITLDFREGDDGPLSGMQRAAFSMFAPVQDAVASVTSPIGDFLSTIGNLGRLRERNEALEDELETLRERRLAVADLERENAELRELLDMKERQEFTAAAARVIAEPPGGSRWSALIDLGSDDGVEPDMAVLNADGLVGKIVEVSGSYARLQMVTSPDARYAVRLADGGEVALLSGRGNLPLELQVIEDSEATLEAGTDVVTRAFQGGRIPDGLPVGRLQQGGETDRTPAWPVEPVVDFSRLDTVLVVLDQPEAPVELDSEADSGPSPEEPLPDDAPEGEAPPEEGPDGEALPEPPGEEPEQAQVRAAVPR